MRVERIVEEENRQTMIYDFEEDELQDELVLARLFTRFILQDTALLSSLKVLDSQTLFDVASTPVALVSSGELCVQWARRVGGGWRDG